MSTPSPDMGLTISDIGSTPDPEWESNLNESLYIIDAHDHSGAPDGGVQLQPLAITFEGGTGFDFGNTVQTDAAAYVMTEAAAGTPPITPNAGEGGLYVDSTGQLHYVSSSSDFVLATLTGLPITSSSNGFTGSDYQVNGGNAFYVVSESGWPFANTFYFYTATGLPTNDTGTRAGLAAALLDLKNIAGAGSLAVFFTPTNSGALEQASYSGANDASNVLEWGLSIGRNSSGTEYYAPALVSRETSASITMSSAHPTVTNARTYTTYINGSPYAGTGEDFAYALGVRSVSYAGASATSKVTTGYELASLANTSGAIQTPGTGFGLQHDYRVQYANTDFAHNAVASAVQSYWWSVGSTQGAWAVYPAGGGTLTTSPAIEAGYAADGSGIAMGIGTTATQSTQGLKVGLSTIFEGAVIIDGTAQLQGGTQAYGGLTVETGAFTVTGGGGTVLQTVVASGSVTSTEFFPSATATGPVSGSGGLFKNTQLLAFGSVSNTGSVSTSYNLSGGVWSPTGTCTVTLTTSISAGMGVACLNTSADAKSVIACSGVSGGNTITVYTWNGSGTAANEPFNLYIVGTP